MRKLISIALILALLIPAQGCATLKNTKVPKAFNDVGVCKRCEKPVALDGLADSDSAVCPECGARFIVKDARLGFKRKIVSLANKKAAAGFMTVTWLAASVAGMFYGIPIPLPPVSADTFSPYRTPLSISCRKAKKAPEAILRYSEELFDTDNNTYKGLYVNSRLPNPYEKEPGAYSLVINDYDDVRNEKLGKASLSFRYDMIYFNYSNDGNRYEREESGRKAPLRALPDLLPARVQGGR